MIVQECTNSYAYKLQAVQFENSIFNSTISFEAIDNRFLIKTRQL